jgi:hypothetical protein
MRSDRRLRRTTLAPKQAEPLNDEQKREIFKALVDSQDGGMTVETSRKKLAETFSLSMDQVVAIEREGLEGQWPPL